MWRSDTVYCQTIVKMLDQMDSAYLVIDFDVLFGLVIVDSWKVLKILHEMTSLWFVMDFNDLFGLVKEDFV